jgi:hypothetical protein
MPFFFNKELRAFEDQFLDKENEIPISVTMECFAAEAGASRLARVFLFPNVSDSARPTDFIITSNSVRCRQVSTYTGRACRAFILYGLELTS